MMWWEGKKVLPKGEDGGKKYNSSGAVGRAALAAALRKDGERKKANKQRICDGSFKCTSVV